MWEWAMCGPERHDAVGRRERIRQLLQRLVVQSGACATHGAQDRQCTERQKVHGVGSALCAASRKTSLRMAPAELAPSCGKLIMSTCHIRKEEEVSRRAVRS